MEKIDKNKMALLFLSLAIDYLHLIENVLKETVKQGNLHMLISDKHVTQDEYMDKTKWSDFHILVPILFNFYHGLELLMKGLCLLTDDKKFKPIHNIEELLECIRDNAKINESIKNILGKHIKLEQLQSDYLKNFLTNNNLSINEMYGVLRYPSDKNLEEIYKYGDLRYKEKKLIEYFKQIIEDSNNLRIESVKLYKKIEK